MSEKVLREQSAEIVALLPKLMRRLSSIDVDDPAMYLPVAQMRVCGVLRDGPRTMSCISKELGVSHSAMTQIADRLERAGLVERVPEAEDRRVKCLQLTAHGAEIMRSRKEKRVARMLEVLQKVSPEDRESAISALRILVEASLTLTPEPAADVLASEALVD